MVLFYYFKGALYDLIQNSFVFPLSRYSGINDVPYGYNLFNGLFVEWLSVLRLVIPELLAGALRFIFLFPFLLIISLPALTLFGVGVSIFVPSKKKQIFNSCTIPYITSGIALWISEIHRWDIFHLIFGSPILFIFFFYILRAYIEKDRNWESAVGLVTLCLIFYGVYSGFIAANAMNKQHTRRGLINNFVEDKALTFMHDEIKRGEEVFVYPYYPMYYFLADIKNPTKNNILVYNINTEKHFKDAVLDLDQKRVKYVLWDTFVAGANIKKWYPKYKHPPNNKLYIERYLQENYNTVDTLNGFKIMRRRQ